MSLWSRRPTTAGQTTRSVTLTHSRWRTSTATSPMPTRLYHKGKTLGREGILFHKHNQEPGRQSVDVFFFFFPLLCLTFPHTKEMFKLSPCSCSRLRTGQLINTSHLFFLHWLDYVGGILKFWKLGRRLILDSQELTSVRQSSSHQLRVVAAVWVIISVAQRDWESHEHPLNFLSGTLGLLCSNTCTALKWLCLR